MAEITRRIGLSLGADICWPICFEEILRRLDLSVRVAGDSVRFEVERVRIEPFDLQQACPYDLVIDRLTHWYHTSREWLKKAVIMDDLYVFNNPWSIQSMEKHTSYCAMMHLGLPVPPTYMLPPKEYEPAPDLESTLRRYATIFDLGEIGLRLGYPLFIKPYDGGAWVGVTKIDDEEALRKAYDESGKRIMHLQKSVEGWDLFVRCLGVGPQVNVMPYDPAAPLHDRYKVRFNFLDGDEWSLLRDMTLTINTFFGWDFNSCECLREGGVFHPIDFANACPDSQVTSLHYHFPWLVKAKLRWAIFRAAYKQPMRRTMDWGPYYEVAARDLPFREALREYAKIADQRLDTARFQEFCDTELPHLDEVAWEFFGSAPAKTAVRNEVAALYPEQEVEKFTELFWSRIERWREVEGEPR
jgi:hypothetical protein